LALLVENIPGLGFTNKDANREVIIGRKGTDPPTFPIGFIHQSLELFNIIFSM
jgi:hypothetical protein